MFYIIEIERNTVLIAIEPQVIGTFTSNIGRAELACIIPFTRLFNFNHCRPHIPQHHRTIWPREPPRQINNHYIRKSRIHAVHPPNRLKSKMNTVYKTPAPKAKSGCRQGEQGTRKGHPYHGQTSLRSRTVHSRGAPCEYPGLRTCSLPGKNLA